MDAIDRMRAAVNFQAYDRPPFVDNEWNETLAEMVPALTGCPPRADHRYAESERAAAIRASMDMIPWCHVYDHPRYPVLGRIPDPPRGQRVTDKDGFVWIVSGYTEWVLHRPFSDVNGFLAYLDRKGESHRERQELPADFPLHLAQARRMLGDATAIGLPYLSVGLDNLYRLAGWDIFAEAVIDHPKVIARYLGACADRAAQLIALYAEHVTARHCPVALLASDIACNTGLLLSPRFLRLALKPALAKIVNAYYAQGIKVVYHSEGDLREILDDLIDAGVDGINPLSPSENMDPVEIRALYPDLILWGGIDERAVLAEGRPDQVRREVRRVVRGVGPGLILGSSGGVHPACPIENLVTTIRALHELGQ